MREVTQKIKFSKGIRPQKKANRNSESLESLVGLKPDYERLVTPKDIIYPVPESQSEPAGYPYPQLFICQRYTFLCTATEIYEVDSDWLLSSIWGGLTENLSWHVADFAEFVIFTNGFVTLCYPEETGELAEISCFQYW